MRGKEKPRREKKRKKERSIGLCTPSPEREEKGLLSPTSDGAEQGNKSGSVRAIAGKIVAKKQGSRADYDVFYTFIF